MLLFSTIFLLFWQPSCSALLFCIFFQGFCPLTLSGKWENTENEMGNWKIRFGIFDLVEYVMGYYHFFLFGKTKNSLLSHHFIQTEKFRNFVKMWVKNEMKMIWYISRRRRIVPLHVWFTFVVRFHLKINYTDIWSRSRKIYTITM